MKDLLAFSLRKPLFILLAVALFTLAAVSQLPSLRISISAESMMVRDTPEWAFYEQTKKTFGADSITVIFLSDPKLFQAGKLAKIRDAVKRIEALPFVESTSSLFSARNVKNVDDYITTQPFLFEIPSDQPSLERIREEAVANPLIVNNLISEDGTAMAVNVCFKEGSFHPGFDAEAMAAIEKELSALRGTLRTVFQIGSATVRHTMTEKILHDLRHTLPLALLVLLITLAVSLKRLSGAVIPFITATLSVVWTLGMMAWLQIPLNIMTSIVPALLVVIGSTEDIHLIAEYYAGIGKGRQRLSAIRYMTDHMGTTVFLTFITTYLGFLSISLNSIDLLVEFGLVASTGLLFNFLLTVLLVPVCLRFFGEVSSEARAKEGRESGILLDRISKGVVDWTRQHKYPMLVLLVAGLVISGAGSSLIRVSNNPMDYLEASSPLRKQAELLHQKLSGLHTLSIVLESGIDGTFVQAKYLQELRELQDHLRDSGKFDHSFSFADFISIVHNVMEEGESGEFTLPEEDDVTRAYMLFIKHNDVREYVSSSYDKAKILVRHNIDSSYELNRAIERIRAFAALHTNPALKVDITGDSIMANQAVESMAMGQAKSLGLMLLVIFILVSLLYLSPRAGLVAVIPNLFAISSLFGVMGFAGIALDTGTAMVAAIALGICVDDTMHTMGRYHTYVKKYRDEEVALMRTMQAEAVPIVTTSLALAAGFAALVHSSFVPVMNFGLLSAMVVLVALLTTFLFTPILLPSTHLVTAWDFLNVRLRSRCRHSCTIFNGMSDFQIKKILLSSDVRHYAPGEVIFRQGEQGKQMCIVLEGLVELYKENGDREATPIRIISMGESFGEVSLVADQPRIATSRAASPTQVLVLEWRNIYRLARLFPRISMKLYRNLSTIVGKKYVDARQHDEFEQQGSSV
jgi:predicted RND superfamily exporter protein